MCVSGARGEDKTKSEEAGRGAGARGDRKNSAVSDTCFFKENTGLLNIVKCPFVFA